MFVKQPHCKLRIFIFWLIKKVTKVQNFKLNIISKFIVLFENFYNNKVFDMTKILNTVHQHKTI